MAVKFILHYSNSNVVSSIKCVKLGLDFIMLVNSDSYHTIRLEMLLLTKTLHT